MHNAPEPDKTRCDDTTAEPKGGGDLVVAGGTEVAWQHRWYEEQIFANRLSFYMLAQSFLVIAAVTATLSGLSLTRWLPVALTIDITGLMLTLIFWYVFTENLRMLTTLKELVDHGSEKIGVYGYEEIGKLREDHSERRRQRHLLFPFTILRAWSPSTWLASGISILFGIMWVTLIGITIATAA